MGGLNEVQAVTSGVFRSAFSTCMARNHTAQYVGSMTLWIDQACNW